MKKAKVLEVAYPALNNSGVPAVIMGIIRELHKNIDFDILVFRSEVGYHEEEFLSYGGKIHHIDSDRTNGKIKKVVEMISRPWRLYFGTRKILREGHYNAIHCHNGFDSCWCLMAAKKEGVPVRAVHSHASVNPFEKKRPLVSIYEVISRNIINRYSTNRIGCSQIAADRLYGERKSTEIIVNAVDLCKFNLDQYPQKTFEKKKPSFVFIGRLTEQKNPQFIIDLFSAILDDIPDSKLTIVGFGPLEELVKNRIRESGIEDHVTILPHSSDVPSVLADSDFFLFPSLFEGFGIALVEAQSMGVYAFASDTIPREADLGVCEFITIREGPEKWKQRIVEVVQNTQVRRTPDEQLMQAYSWKSVAEKYRKIYIGSKR